MDGSVPGFAPEFFDALPTLEEDHFWFTARNTLIAWAVRRYFPAARTFLEAGCGTAQVTASLQRACPHLSFTASEALLEGLSVAERKAPGAELVQVDVVKLPWDAEFDVAGAFDVLEHVADDAAAIRQLARAVRPGGGVIVTVPQHPWLWSPVDEYSRHERRYTRKALVDRLEEAGLHIERVTSFVSLLLPMLLLSRATQRGRPVDPHAEYRIGRIFNTVGGVLMNVERSLIRAGVSLPAGGSLLAVATRR
jgi:SAM-dependent methyltransferase